MKLVFAEAAREDLLSIGNWIAQADPLKALSFMEELEARCFGITDFPEAFALLPRHEHAGIRRVVHGNYSIFYAATDAVYILHILTSSMDYERILFPDP